MSWLSSLFSGPKDNSLQIEQMRIAQQQRAAAQAKADAEAERQRVEAELAQRRTSSSTAAQQAARDYFSQRGLDPNQYGSQIDSYINNILSGVSKTDPNPESYFTDAGQGAYGSLTSAQQQKALGEVNQLFSPDYSYGAIASTADDPYLAEIEAKQRGEADRYIQNLLSRGVITGTGAQEANRNLDTQAAAAREKLRTIGDNTLASGRSSLEDIANQARLTASGLNLGQSFDPTTYWSRAQDTIGSFLGNLGDTIKSQVTSPLFQIGDLPWVAGAASGAQNTKFDPKALAGIYQTDEEKKKTSGTSGASIF